MRFKAFIEKAINFALALTLMIGLIIPLTVTVQASGGIFVALEDDEMRISFSSNPISSRDESAWGTIHTFNVGTTMFIELSPNIHPQSKGYHLLGMSRMTLLEGSTTMFKSEHVANWNMTNENLGSIILNSQGRFNINGVLTIYVVGNATTPTPTPLPAQNSRYFIGDVHGLRFYFCSAPLNSEHPRNSWRFDSIYTVNVGTTLFGETPAPTVSNFLWWAIRPSGPNGVDYSATPIPWNVINNNSGYTVLNTIGLFAICGTKDGRFFVNVVGNAATPTPVTTPTPTPTPITTSAPTATPTPPPANPSIPQFTNPPTSTDTGVWMEFTTVPNNRFGYRIFRATTATGAGISITDFPIMVNPAHSLNRIITFDPNLRPDRDYWFYVREVIEEARFDASTTTLIPEVLGPPSARVHVRTSGAMTETDAERGFIMMFIGNPFMNVNNVWEGIDPPTNNTAPIINAGRTMVPIRAIVEAMGGGVGWHSTLRRVDLWSHGNHVQMWLGERNAGVNGVTHEMDVVPQVINDRTLIPLRFVAEFLDQQVEWIGSQQMVVIVYELQ